MSWHSVSRRVIAGRHAKLFGLYLIKNASMKNMPALQYWTAAAALMFLIAAGRASEDTDSPPLFESDTLIVARVIAPFTSIMRDRSETEYRDGRFIYVDDSGVEQELRVKLRTRGRYRRKKDICDFAPLRLNFSRKQVAETEFAGQDKLKLVTHCKSGRGNYQAYVLKEYLAYRIFETLTEQSFKTRLLQITYVDTDREHRVFPKYAFVIEEKEAVGERLGWELVDVPRILPEQLDRNQANLISVFEYFIGNTDFSMVLGALDDSCCHNIVLYSATPGTFIPVPYDFDLAGIVNAPYATANPKYKLDKVTDRLYLGRCGNNDLLEATLAQFKDKEQEMREMLADLNGLNSFRKRQVRRFIDDFYEDFESARALEKNFVEDCS